MFKIKGATVYPSEVEEGLLTIPGVQAAFASDINLGGSLAVGAAVLPESGARLDVETLAEAARTRLSAFKLPVRWVILTSLDELPTLATGKLDKTKLRAKLAEGAAAPHRQAPQ
jgi:acyl-CoA synthetase (AMP-forming)/AMP-acid ligase II